MKVFRILLAGCLLATFACLADTTTTTKSADKKWSEAVEKMIAAGPTTISTPSESRAELAKSLAEKAGRKCEVKRIATGYRIEVK